MNDQREIFVSAIQNDLSVPSAVRANADKLSELEEATFDQTYLDFLDQQIELCPRGESWNNVLKSRRSALSSFCNKPLLRALVEVNKTKFMIRVNPEDVTVVHWEEQQ